MPVRASEDFSFYLKEKPGALFFMGSAKMENDTYLHDSKFNFNDSVIDYAANFWLNLALDRLQI